MSLNQITKFTTNGEKNFNIACNDIQVTCDNGDFVTLKPPTKGTIGQVLTSDGLGGVQFVTGSSGTGNGNLIYSGTSQSGQHYMSSNSSGINVTNSSLIESKTDFNFASKNLINTPLISNTSDLKIESTTDVDINASRIDIQTSTGDMSLISGGNTTIQSFGNLTISSPNTINITCPQVDTNQILLGTVSSNTNTLSDTSVYLQNTDGSSSFNTAEKIEFLNPTQESSLNSSSVSFSDTTNQAIYGVEQIFHNGSSQTLNNIITKTQSLVDGILTGIDSVNNSTGTLQLNAPFTVSIDTNLTTFNNSTLQTNASITGNSFVKIGGTGQQVLLADGTTAPYTGGSGNSNFYPYRNDLSIIVPPSQAGKLNYNNSNQSLATKVYINHLTEDNIDIDFFFSLFVITDFLYIQDRTNSTNWIKYEITGKTIFPNNYVELDVTYIDSEGNGSATFGSNHEIVFTVFSNTPAIQTRLDALENKTQYQSTPIANQTNFTGSLFADSIKKSGGLNTEYLMASGDIISGLYNIASVGTGNSLINTGTGSDFKIKSLIAGTNITMTPTTTDITINSTTAASTLSNAGPNTSLVASTSAFPNFQTKSISTSTGISLIDLSNNLTLTNTSPASSITLSSVGSGNSLIPASSINPTFNIKSLVAGSNIGIQNNISDLTLINNSPASSITLNNSGIGSSLINTILTSNPNLYLKSLSAGTGMSFLDTANNLLLTNSSPSSSISLTNAGVGNSLLSSTTNPSFSTKGLIAGTNMNITSSATDLTLSPNLSSVVLKAGDIMTGQLTVPALVINTGTVINSLPYFNNNSQVVSNQSNLYCQAGLDNLQVILNNLVTSQNYSIQLSSGTHTGNIQIIGQDKTLSGQPSPLFTQTSIISGNLIMGNQSSLSTRLKVNNLQINGNLTFTNDSVFQGLNYSFSNCNFLGASIQFVTSGVINTFINFFDCTFNQNFTIPNNTIFYNFTRCNFRGFTISNNMIDPQYVTFEDCRGLLSLSLGNCTLIGANETFLGVSQLNSTQLRLSGGTDRQYLKGTGNFEIDTSNYRYTSWGYVQPAVLTVVDCPTSLMTNLGGSLSNFGINSALTAKGYKIRVGSVVPNTSNGSTSGWLGTATLNYILPKAGWYIKIGFSLDAQTATSTGNRTMIGLFQSTTRPLLDNTITIDSVTTGSMGIIQEKGENFFSFNTRGTTGSTKIITAIPCSTPTNNWYTLEMYNEPFSLDIKMILTCQTSTETILSETVTFTCGGTNTMPALTSYVHLQQSMASAGGVNNSALLTLGNITMKLAQ